MCAIAGIFHGEDALSLTNETTAIISHMAHRGPDGIYTKALNKITLGHARLIITDASHTANQPMFTADGKFAIVFNGAIYNFRELRAELIKKGVEFTTGSDTEVFINLFAQYGVAGFDMLEGMFAAAIWDVAAQKLTLVRDRFGEKPLYYRQLNGKFYFASECDALAITGPAPAINLSAINHLLAIGYVLNPDSIYEGIYAVPPATYFEITDAGKKTKQTCYWNYSRFFEQKTKLSFNDALEQFKELYQSAVLKCAASETQPGYFLSGGLDSASVVSVVARQAAQPLKTYTIYFENNQYSEKENAAYTAQFFNCDSKFVLFNDEDIKNSASQIINHLSSPITDNSFLPTYRLAAEAKKYGRIIINGDGADELLAGYSTYKADKVHALFYKLPAAVKKLLSQYTPFPEGNKALSPGFIQKQFFAGTLADYRQAHYNWRLLHNPEQRIAIMGTQHKELVYDTDPFKKFDTVFSAAAHLARPDQCLVVDAHTWLTDNILVKTDRALMSHGIESRAPFLNHKLAEFLATLPFKWKLKGFTDKYLLRRAMKDFLPPQISSRSKKGFNTPPFLKQKGQNQFSNYNEWFVKNYRHGLLNNKLNLG